MQLQGLGHTAEGVATGADALQSATSFHPDVVLLDATMPGLSGVELLDALLQVASQTRVMVMTGDPARAAAMLERGAIAYLTKPFKIEALAETLKKVLA